MEEKKMNLCGRRVFGAFAFFTMVLLAAGCQGPSRRIYSLTGGELYSGEWMDVVREDPVTGDENIKVTDLFRDENSSHHIVQINDAEKPHIHSNHDLTVVLKQGEGTLNLRESMLPMSAGDVAFIPRGNVHWFVNNKKGSTAVAYLIFSPAYDGMDRKPFYLPKLK